MASKRAYQQLADRINRAIEVNVNALYHVCQETSVPIPTDMAEAYSKYIRWRHITTNQEVRGLNFVLRDYFEKSSCWRVETKPDGSLQRISGSDLIYKSRKMFCSSGIMGASAISMCQMPNSRAIMVVQRKKTDLMYPIWRDFGYMLAGLPPGWMSVVRSPASEIYGYYLENASSWEMQTAGSTESVADALVRSGTPRIVHLSEAAIYDHYPHVISSVVGALPEEGSYLIAETTPSRSREHPVAQEFGAMERGQGTYRRHFFYPWFRDPHRIVKPSDDRYPEVMCADFEERLMQPDDFERELLHALSLEQRAWRRWNYLRGSAKNRSEKRREFPEDTVTCYGIVEGEPYINRLALDLLSKMKRDPIYTEKLQHRWTGYVWHRNLDMVLVTTDMATFYGKDASVVLAVDPYTLDVVALVHGDATAAMHHDGIKWALAQVGCEAKAQHWVSPETNYDDKIGLVQDRLVKDASIRLWYKTYVSGPRREHKVAKNPGYHVSVYNRERLIDGLIIHLEGDLSDPEMAGPMSQIPSEIMIDEAGWLQQKKNGRIEAAEGKHDDTMLALAGAVYTRRFLRLPAKRSAAAEHAAALGLMSSSKKVSRKRPR